MYTLHYSHLEKVFHLFLKSQISTNRIVCYSRPSTHPPSFSFCDTGLCVYIHHYSSLYPIPSPFSSTFPSSLHQHSIHTASLWWSWRGWRRRRGGRRGRESARLNERRGERERENFSLKETSNQERRDITVSALLFIYGWFPTAPS